ncbi:hypothetical protein HN924_00120 [Candidatus Woesearchaeota archaeon]|jgi:hypothetical protein|nr:hypothetical protein [Candidatus Woesearchaeota archaeon]MBT7062356.1 hypothetical protein [Candidatus Woesearchaeota archaeon]MBT7402825.1 hypothetical protein [Candidatus Woesearchaeota archaeon]
MANKINAGKYLKIVLGLLIIVAGLYSYTFTCIGGYPWYWDLIRLIKGGFGIGIMFIGLLVAAIGATD